MSKNKTYNIMEEFPFGNVIWAINPEKESVTCVLRKHRDFMDILSDMWNNNQCIIINKYIATSKTSHGDKFDVQVGMGLSLMKVMLKSGMGKNMTSITKMRKMISSKSADRTIEKLEEQVEAHEKTEIMKML